MSRPRVTGLGPSGVSPWRHHHGFTLVEVLVAIAIVASLLAVLVPSLHSMQQATRSTSCSANLRQMFTAAQSYSLAHHEVLPAAIVYRARPEGLATIAWDFEQRADGTVWPGPMWSFTDDPGETLQCPSFQGPSTFGADPATGYNYNTSYLGAEGRFPEMTPGGGWLEGWANARRGIPASQHRRPSETAMFGDAGWRGGANKFMRAPSAEVECDLGVVYAGGQAFRHTGCCNVVHLDGHVRGISEACEGPHATEQMLEEVLGFPRNGFLSPDDSAYDPR